MTVPIEVLYVSSAPSQREFDRMRARLRPGAQEVTYGMPEAAGDTTLGHLVVPAVEARLTAGNAELRALRLADLADLCDQVEQLEYPADTRPSVELNDELAGASGGSDDAGKGGGGAASGPDELPASMLAALA